ncbi:hypothetical protein [Rhizobium sp. MHM7A]|uniref:hypothetical protein n=1 Tax=Rhizobium sp. MHM7A TaxID=2583233 RepID=UPI001106B1E4|nr:hypothetical protein [Rhizobium sp. MHM7A]TLX16830.1 hypothetical protein FFR93_05650 [Rhizobium sp. MHM7A]
MFWNSEPERDFGRMCRMGEREADDAIIKFNRDYTKSCVIPDEILCRASLAELAEEAGFVTDDFAEVIDKALRSWRNSPSRSILNVTRLTDGAVPGTPMFKDLRSQHQLLSAAMVVHLFQPYQFRTIPDRETEVGRLRPKPLKIGDFVAMTADADGERLINSLAYAVRLWEERNKAMVRTGRVKLPTKLYRGIRGGNLAVTMADLPSDLERSERDCRLTMMRAQHLVERPIAEWSHSPILSFTTNETVANFFTRNEGFVVEFEPTLDMVVASHLTDNALDVVDPYLKKHEREWILRLPADAQLEPDAVRPQSAAWFAGTRDYRGIAVLDSHVEAKFLMGNKELSAHWRWNNNGKGGKVVFRENDDFFSLTRAEFKKEKGYDPVPQAASEIRNLVYFRKESSTFNSKPPVEIPHWRSELFPEEFSPAP